MIVPAQIVLPDVTEIVGLATVTVTVPIDWQLAVSRDVTVYVVVDAGDAMTLPPDVADSPVDGLHV